MIEGSQAVIHTFSKNFPECNADVVRVNFEEFNTDRTFDMIVMGFILEHVDDPVHILKIFRKFLAPGGRLFVSVPNAEVLNRRLGHAMGLLPDMQLLSEHDHLLGHQRYYTVDSLTADLRAAGYATSRVEGIYLKPLTTRQILSLNLDRSAIDALCTVGIDYPELCCGILAEARLD